jgi:hypothetical protein
MKVRSITALFLVTLPTLLSCAAQPENDTEAAVSALGSSITLIAGDSARGGYDFSAQAFTGLSGGDFYFTQAKFWANNTGQRGVVRVGPCSGVSSVKSIPTSGYSRFGVTATSGNCYVALTHNDERDFIVFRVNRLTQTSAALTWTLVSSGNSGATLLAGDASTGGYLFSQRAYRGLSGGDLYFTQGALWANNFDQRGVVSAGPCAKVDGTLPVPASGYSRYGVTATAGNCYFSRLSDDNRHVALLRVDDLTSTTATITWRLVTVPLAQLAWLHCEPYQPVQAVPATTTESTLTTWLAQNAAVASAMQWLLPQVAPQSTVGWDAWPADLRALLLQNFTSYWAWYAGGMTGADPSPLVDPPVNHASDMTAEPYTALSATDAEALYAKYLALTFVVELQHRTAWSLLGYDAASQAELLDSRKFFNSYAADGYRLIEMSVLPGPPLDAATLVVSNGLLCSTRRESIGEAVFWSRHLSHYNNTAGDDWADAQNFWQYRGNPPASRVINGTSYSGPDSSVDRSMKHWTMGCHGTVGLLKTLLRTINIPVEHYSNRNAAVGSTPTFAWTGHATAHFLSEGAWLSHGDDPYMMDYSVLPFPPTAFLISDQTFSAWFPPGQYTLDVANQVGRQHDEIWVQYLGRPMLDDRWADEHDNPTTPDANLSALFAGSPPNNYYTWPQAQAAGVPARLDALLAPYTDTRFVTDYFAVPNYY